MPEPSTAPVISPFLNAVIGMLKYINNLIQFWFLGGITGAIEISITYPT